MIDRRPHLVLFLTRRMSLKTWHELGTLDRELAVYRRLLDRGIRVSIVSYGGGRRERDLIRDLPEFDVACNHRRLPRRVYELAIPWLHHRLLASATVIKTNQMNGAQFAIAAARRFDKPLIARCGYLWSSTEATNHGRDSAMARHAAEIEAAVWPAASRIVVTTEAMAAHIKQRFPAAISRLHIIPNVVDTDLFSPRPADAAEYDFVFVGRLAPEKNVAALLEAVEGVPGRLLIIGGGSEQAAWQRRYAHLGDRVAWIPQVPNAQLPRYLTAAKALVLPSLYEGHPKVAVEAMACGLPVIGSDVAGIRDLVVPHKTGLLCGTSADEIRRTLLRIANDQPLRQRLGAEARRVALAQFSLDRAANLEGALIAELSNSELAAHYATPRQAA